MAETPDLTIGSLAPEFRLSASSGTEIALLDFRNKNNLYLFFVREYN